MLSDPSKRNYFLEDQAIFLKCPSNTGNRSNTNVTFKLHNLHV